jgi:zinc-ribbon domain
MFCPSCGKQVQENNSFCPYCGKTLSFNNVPSPPPIQSAPQQPQPSPYHVSKPIHNSHAGRNIAIGVLALIFVSFIIAFAASSYLDSLNSSGGGNGIFQTTHTTNIVNGLVTVNAGTYETYTFTVPSGASNVQVSGSFTASGGSGNDVRIFILAQSDFVNWANGHSSQCYYQSGQTSTGTISASLPTSGTYVLVYDNTFSVFSQKNVNTEVDVSYLS